MWKGWSTRRLPLARGITQLEAQKAETEGWAEKAQEQLAQVSRDGNRYLLARIPVVERDGTYTLVKVDTQNGKKRTAAQLRGNDQG